MVSPLRRCSGRPTHRISIILRLFLLRRVITRVSTLTSIKRLRSVVIVQVIIFLIILRDLRSVLSDILLTLIRLIVILFLILLVCSMVLRVLDNIACRVSDIVLLRGILQFVIITLNLTVVRHRVRRVSMFVMVLLLFLMICLVSLITPITFRCELQSGRRVKATHLRRPSETQSQATIHKSTNSSPALHRMHARHSNSCPRAFLSCSRES